MFQWNTTRTLVMGILNVTPDSFSDGGRFFDVESAVEHAREMSLAGADIIDVGGESTRPGAEPVSAEEELRRVMPVVERLSGGALGQRALPVTVDTTKAVVAERALAAGARVINDVSALRFDPRMIDVVRERGAGVVLMHMQGTPQTMQQNPHYSDVVREVSDFLAERVAWAVERGLEKSQIAVDPGIGFGKTLDHNLQLLANMEVLSEIGCPVVIGASRKMFVGKLLGDRDIAGRVWGSVGVAVWAAMNGAAAVRVHDVAETADALRVIDALRKTEYGILH
jgi:dihydropteroate synthase